MRRFAHAAIPPIVALIVSSSGLAAQATDVVVLRNGDTVTGEVLALSRGNLDVDTDAMNVVSIDWDDVTSVSTDHIFEVTDVTGRQFYGRLSAGDRERVLVVGLGPDDAGEVSLPFAVIIDMRELNEGFIAKTSGYVDVGANVARANRLRSLLFKGRFVFRGRIWEVDATSESYAQTQTSTTQQGGDLEERTSRNSMVLSGRRFFNADWAASASAKVEQNEELNLDRRFLLSLGGRYNIVRNHGLEIFAGASGVLNEERFTDEEATTSPEVNLSIGFDMFDVGDLDVFTLVDGYKTPGEERYRLNIDARVSWEIVSDFSIGLTAVERYDSSPEGDAEQRDFQYGVTVGWSWG
jgi:Protein of unknown function, DUF481